MNAIAEPTDCTVEHADCVEARTCAAWRKETGLVLARGSAWTLACLAVLVIVDLAVDWWLDLPAYFRLTLLLVNLAVLAVVVRRRLLCDLRRYRPVELRFGWRRPAPAPVACWFRAFSSKTAMLHFMERRRS